MAAGSKTLAETFPPEVRAKMNDELLVILDILEALEAGDHEKLREVGPRLPIDPIWARGYKRMFGKEALLAAGFNLSEANKEMGEGWIDEPEERR